MKLRTRFGVIVVLAISAILGIGFVVVRRHQKQALEDAAYKRANAVLAFAEACRGMVRESLRPAAAEAFDEFTPELMSSTYVTRATFSQLQDTLPSYVYRQPTLRPLNAENKANAFEAEVIGRFQKSPTLTVIKGTREVDGRMSYFVARPEVVKESCLACHGNPEDAPVGLAERYGRDSGFGWEPGTVAGITMVTVPIDDLLASQASLNIHVFWVFLLSTLCLGFFVDSAFDRMVNRRLDKASRIMERVAADPALHLRVDAEGHDEITQMALAFNDMADSLQEAAATLERRVERRTSELNDARQSERAKDEFLANMSHELRTPLTAILGFGDELALRADELPPSCVEIVDVINENGRHLLRLINDILDISKIIAGEMEVEVSDWSPDRLVAEIHSVMGPRARARGITLQVSAEGSLPECVRGDVFRTKQILYNLVGNAIKFTEEGSVTLTVRFEPGEGAGILSFDVKDTGIGIAPDLAVRVFQRFKQADGSTTRRFGGSGLGLDISMGLAGLLGGDLTLVDSSPGRGSLFRLTLPVEIGLVGGNCDGNASSPCRQGKLEDLKARLDCRLLVAEDNPVNQRIVLRVLEYFGADVQLVSNGRDAMNEALKAVEEDDPFDVILMDMHMPEMDGLEAIRRLRDVGYDRPIIVLSAAVMPAEIQSCREAGCDAVACKPIERQELFDVLARFVEESPRLRPVTSA